jgi:hypothetical protein
VQRARIGVQDALADALEKAHARLVAHVGGAAQDLDQDINVGAPISIGGVCAHECYSPQRSRTTSSS